MKKGISSYCLSPAMAKGASIYDVIDFAKGIGCEHIEFVPFYTPFVIEKEGRVDSAYIESVRKKCEDVSLEISTYSVNADLLNPDKEAREREFARVKLHIDAAEQLGLHVMRHDVASFRRPFSSNTPENFEKELPLMVDGIRRLYEYADKKGIDKDNVYIIVTADKLKKDIEKKRGEEKLVFACNGVDYEHYQNIHQQ